MLRKKVGLLADLSVIFALTLFIFAGCLTRGHAQPITPEGLEQLEYRFIGPPGNRLIAVAGIPGDVNTAYVGAASGGIWKSSDGGVNWEPIFDDQEVSSIGSLAIAASDPNVIWAGTGEAFIRGNISIGNGIYKSTDAGKTWKHMGLDKSGRIGRVVIHPGNPDIVFAAAMGHCYGPQKERGLYRTTDGGETWEQILFVDENTGAADIAMDPNNPRILFAGMWQLDIKTWGRWSGGPGSGLYKSTDGGTTWKHLTPDDGLPESPVGRIGVAISRSNSKRVYALIETYGGSLWRSDDGGDKWNLVSYRRELNERPHYYSRLEVLPDDEDEVFFIAAQIYKTLDGGVTASAVPTGQDPHDMWIDPTNPNRIYLADDHGILFSVDRGKFWRRAILPVSQMYHVAVDNQVPYFVYGNEQDGPSFRGPSNSLLSVGISSHKWRGVAGCESGFGIPDPVDNNITWGGCYNAGLDRHDLRTGHAHSVRVWPESPMGWPAADLKYRFQWTFPIAISPHDHNKVYVGSQHVHQTTDGGHSWSVISPDLSTNNTEYQQISGGIAPDNLGVEYGCVVFALAESPLEAGLIWAGTNDGQVQVTRDGGTNWTNVTANIPELPPLGTVSNIEPSRYDAGAAYITVDLHQVDNRDPFVYKTADYGESWKLISADVPKSVFSYAHCVREDPKRKGLLYLGTENALYVSFDDGTNWMPLQSNMPRAPVHWMVVQENFNDLVVATYGRGFWIMDDITPLQQLTGEVLESDVSLLTPRPSYRFIYKAERRRDLPNDQCVGQNPPYGASLNYYSKSAAEDGAELTILDESGKTIRNLTGPMDAGINRVWWDLRHEPQRQPKLRTQPLDFPHEKFNKEGWRPLRNFGISRGLTPPLVSPGTYTVKLAVDGQEFTQTLEVRKDPSSASSLADIKAQEKMLLALRDDLNTVTDMINQTEWMRKQISDLIHRLEEDEGSTELVAAAKELDDKLLGVSENLYQVRLAGGVGGSENGFRRPAKLFTQICMLIGDVGVRSADFPPTTQQVAVHELFKERLATYQGQLNDVINTDVAAFHNLLRQNNIESIVTKMP